MFNLTTLKNVKVVAMSALIAAATIMSPITAQAASSCTINLVTGANGCAGNPDIQATLTGGQLLVKVSLPPGSGNTKAHFLTKFGAAPSGTMVHIGDSSTNFGSGGDFYTQSRDAEMIIRNGNLDIYGNDHILSTQTSDGYRKVGPTISGIGAANSTWKFTVSNNKLQWVLNGSGAGSTVTGNPSTAGGYMYALAGQFDNEGPVNYDIYAAFNQTIFAGYGTGTGVEKVTITLN